MGKLIFLGVTAFLAVRYISKTAKNTARQLTATSAKTIDHPPVAKQLPPAGGEA